MEGGRGGVRVFIAAEIAFEFPTNERFEATEGEGVLRRPLGEKDVEPAFFAAAAAPLRIGRPLAELREQFALDGGFAVEPTGQEEPVAEVFGDDIEQFDDSPSGFRQGGESRQKELAPGEDVESAPVAVRQIERGGQFAGDERAFLREEPREMEAEFEPDDGAARGARTEGVVQEQPQERGRFVVRCPAERPSQTEAIGFFEIGEFENVVSLFASEDEARAVSLRDCNAESILTPPRRLRPGVAASPLAGKRVHGAGTFAPSADSAWVAGEAGSALSAGSAWGSKTRTPKALSSENGRLGLPVQ